MSNYFNKLTQTQKLEALGKCDFLDASEFSKGLEVLKDKKVVIIGCGSQGLNQGLNMRDSGLDISYALREVAISEKGNPIKMLFLMGLKSVPMRHLFRVLI